jgi:hypothetical protein
VCSLHYFYARFIHTNTQPCQPCPAAKLQGYSLNLLGCPRAILSVNSGRHHIGWKVIYNFAVRNAVHRTLLTRPKLNDEMKTFSIRALIPPPVLRRRCVDQRRFYAIEAAGAPAVEVFNNRTKWLQKERAAADVEGSRKVDYLRDEVASRLSERLLVKILKLLHVFPNC